MEKYFKEVLPDIVGFFKVKYKTMPEPRNGYRFIHKGEKPQSGCGEMNENRYSYCPDDDTVYLGQMAMWDFYHNVGAIAPAIGLAHEWGHHIQSMKSVPDLAADAEQVQHENQADCIAGAWIRYADQQDRLEQKDFQDIEKFIEYIASAEGPGRNHGKLDERRHATLQGMNGGLEACNSFYPETPIITGRD